MNIKVVLRELTFKIPSYLFLGDNVKKYQMGNIHCKCNNYQNTKFLDIYGNFTLMEIF